jgi:hypothetical protein
MPRAKQHACYLMLPGSCVQSPKQVLHGIQLPQPPVGMELWLPWLANVLFPIHLHLCIGMLYICRRLWLFGVYASCCLSTP